MMTPLRILFIGNSHTYLHKMPWILKALAAAHGGVRPVEPDQCTGNGVSLGWHWRNPDTRSRIAADGWDFVVLQERSGGTIENPKGFYRHARLLDADIRATGAKTVFYMTWAGRQRPQDQPLIAGAYRQVAAACRALLAPVGIAWQRALAEDPDCHLHHPDGRHAGPSGAYLTACVFFRLFCGASPVGLPGRIHAEGKLRVDLSPERARFFQRVASDEVDVKSG
jgi:hypothetical protein